ncbi:MAG: bifunctional nuclease family protein [Actinomycetota bacterium]|nr:bifunctional nuclease family protein [Actinomycetota bacterium]
MSRNINVEVNSIRLEESSETPILLLLDPSTQKVLPIWIGTIEAVSIAYAQEGILHDRPQTHDLLLNIVEALEGSISEVNISNIEDSTYFADIILNTVNGLVTLSARPSDAIALALRSNIPVTVNQEVFETNSIDLIIDNANEIEEFKEFIKDVKPEDFS